MTPPPALKGKTVIVTGAGRGIGRAIARRLSTAGADVAITARTEPQLDETRRLIERAGGSVLAMPADVANERDVERLVEAVMERFGRIGVLVNNAGTAPLARIDEMEPDVFDHTIATNIRSVYLCSRAVWGIMAEAGEGIIVNISSLSAYDPFLGFAA
jgi:NAD(P)-dependent dehydrogenase (short-subunit alcohol dehydrogenase family)